MMETFSEEETVELSTTFDGRYELRLHSPNDAINLYAVDSIDPKLKIDHLMARIQSPSHLRKEDLLPAARQVAHLINDKNEGHPHGFGLVSDRRYIAAVAKRYQELGLGHQFQVDVNKALGPQAQYLIEIKNDIHTMTLGGIKALRDWTERWREGSDNEKFDNAILGEAAVRMAPDKKSEVVKERLIVIGPQAVELSKS